jgi:DNA-binding transcriptional regulator GbsR (MarR family)
MNPTDPSPTLALAEAKAQFIHTWGVSGASWGVSKTLAQVHALLLVSPAALSTEDIMDQLTISRGNASMTGRPSQRRLPRLSHCSDRYSAVGYRVG